MSKAYNITYFGIQTRGLTNYRKVKALADWDSVASTRPVDLAITGGQ